MAGVTKSQKLSLKVSRTFAAPRERVFAAWTRPDELKRWSAPGAAAVTVAEVDLRVGGTYRLHMRAPDGTEYRVTGSYREIAPPKRLVYTWFWETDPDAGEMLVSIDFIERGGGTEVVLVHSQLASEAGRAGHEQGWQACLEQLAEVVDEGGEGQR